MEREPLWVGSTFSGVGGMDIGLERAGMRHAFFAEVDPWRRRVLAAHHPGVPVFDDVRAVTRASVDERLASAFGDAWTAAGGRLEPRLGDPRIGDEPGRVEDRAGVEGHRLGDSADRPGVHPLDRSAAGRGDRPRIDVLCGGFPCQDLSVAGRRRGLAGERSGLFFEFARIADDLRPTVVLLENVPGLLSSNDGRDMGAVVGTLADLGYSVGWRVLDARYFGVPQRRRRVFLAGHLGGGPGSALRYLCESCGGDLTPLPCTWQGASGEPRGDAADSGWDADGRPLAHSLTRRHAGSNTSRDGATDNLVAGTLQAAGGERGWRMDAEGASSGHLVAAPVTAKWAKGSGGPAGDETQHLAPALTSATGQMDDQDSMRLVVAPPHAATLTGHRGKDGGGLSPEETLLGVEVVNLRGRDEGNVAEVDPDGLASIRSSSGGSSRSVVAETFRKATKAAGADGDEKAERWEEDDVANTLTDHGLGLPGGVTAVSFVPESGQGADLRASEVDTAPALGRVTQGLGTDRGVRILDASQVRVRRLTPLECERLMGWPDGYTAPEGVKAPDSKRYAACGDGVVANVAEWIGRRIVAADANGPH